MRGRRARAQLAPIQLRGVIRRKSGRAAADYLQRAHERRATVDGERCRWPMAVKCANVIIAHVIALRRYIHNSTYTHDKLFCNLAAAFHR